MFSFGISRLLTAILVGGLALDLAATNHILRQDEIMAGLGGNPNVQFVEITVSGGDQKEWGPPFPGAASRAMLVFFNGQGAEVGRFFFPANAPIGGNTVLIATTNFAALPGAPIPDFIMPPLMSPGSGKVCFRGNPASPGAFDVNLCLSYGTFPGDQTEGAGPPAPALPITGDPISLTRFQNFNFGQGTSRNVDFTLASPTPLNTRGQTMIFPVDGPEIELIPSLVDFGGQNINQGPTAPRTVIITNRGVLNPLILTNVALAGANTNQFNIVADSGQASLAPGGTRTITLNFDPTTGGRKTASLRIICNDTNETVTDLPLQGIGIDPNAPEIDVAPLTINFGVQDIAVGPTAVRNINILNQGQIGSLNISNISLSGSHADQFQIATPTNSSTLGPGATRTVSVTFDPNVAGPKNAVVRIISSDTDEETTDVLLQGRAFDLNPCTAPNPSNSVPQNTCANAQLVCPGTVFTGTLLGATADGSSSCGPGQAPDVWCRYVPSTDGTLVVTATPTSVGLQTLSAHSACPGGVGNELACAIVPIPSPIPTNPLPTARITIAVTQNVPILLRLVGVASANTGFQLVLDGPDCFDFDQNRNGVTDTCEPDFGDAPAPYPTTLAADGPRHRAFSGLFLGARIDPDDDGQPTPLATGDNVDGEINDDDGIVFGPALPMVPGQSAMFVAQSSGAGFLNGWIDFNADGDWTDAGEQIATNHPVVAGFNPISFDVPPDAAITNQTFARFRLSSMPGLTITGAANDGEVEDYVVEILSPSPTPGNLAVRISEVMPGLNGDSSIQFVELEANGDANKAWGPQGTETVGRAMLVFFDGAGVQSGRFVFPSNAPSGGNKVLVATRAFANLTGLEPDFIMPPEVVPIGGKVAFASNPENRRFDIHIALSYGGTEYFGRTDGAGPPNANALPIMHAQSLVAVQEVPFGLNRNGAFHLSSSINSAPTPSNTRGQTASLSAAPVAEQGRTLFTRETFRGNGRTCATCHVPGRDQFGLTPRTIDELPHSDPLFVFEDNVNTLKLAARSRPSDLRGLITGATGTAWVLAGSGDTYQVIGGANLSGAISDVHGNSATFQSFTEGDLDGPTASNDSARGLEDHTLLTHGRGLILENIDGFKAKEVFRASPHLLALARTVPFGLSGEFDSLDAFSDGAVVQHFPKSLARISGVDFRHPTPEELAAMSAFMFGISNPSDKALNLDRLATTEAQKRGRALFFGDEGRCAKCHSGPVLALSDGSLSGSVSNVNENFNTGVANLLKNLPIGDNLPTEPAGLEPGRSTREFNTPGLFGIRLTAPFFHDGSAATLKDAVEFYDTEEFHNSPAGVEVGSLLAANKDDMIADVVAFLESLVELPADFPRDVAFGVRCPGQPPLTRKFAAITNIGSTTITISNVFLNGTNASEFSVVSDSGETSLAPGQTRRFEFAFSPASLGLKRATFEIDAVDTNLLGGFSFGIALSGAELDSFVQVVPLSLDFGTRDIDAPPSPEESIVITNDGSINLEVTVELVGANAADFTMAAETNAIPPHGTRVIQVGFAPRSQGAKSAMVRVRMLSCSGTLIEIPLAGIATSTVHHFAWSSIGATQFVGTPFSVRITAQDRNGETVQNFRGTVRLMSVIGPQTNTISVAPTDSSPFVNGVWNGSITVQQPAALLRLVARDNQGHTGLSDAFRAPLRDDLSVSVADAPDPVTGGQQLVYTITVHNTGPMDATGVVLTDQLSAGVRFISGAAGQGTLSHASGAVTASLGTLPRAANVIVSIIVEPDPPAAASLVTNIATITRTEPEANLDNNTATNTTRIDPFGLLAVAPLANFNSTGFSGGLFSPTNQIYTLSNAGTATLSWQARSSGCAAPPGLVAWWPLDGNVADAAGNHTGTASGGALFTNGLVGQAVAFDGTADDLVRIPAAPVLNVGAGSGLTVEAWINPTDVSQQRPVVEWGSEAVIGVHLWISVVGEAGSGPGSVFANVVDVNGPTSHQIVTVPNLVVANVWQHIALTYSRTTGVATLYLNGAIVRQQNFGSFTPITSSDVLIGKRLFGGPSTFVGRIDEVGIYNRDLSEAEIQSIFVAGAAGKCGAGGSSAFNCAFVSRPVASWPLNGDASDLVNTNNGIVQGGALFTNALVREGLLFDGLNDSVRLPASPALNVGVASGLTVELWIHPRDLQARPMVEWNQGTIGAHFWISVPNSGSGNLQVNLVDVNGTHHGLVSGGGIVHTQGFQHVAVTYDRITGIGTLYHDGRILLQSNLGVFTPNTALDLFFGGPRGVFAGRMDEVAIYDRALSTAEIQSIFAAGAAGKCHGGTFDCAPAGLAGWWPFEGNLQDHGQTNFGVFTGNPVFTNGLVGQAVFFNGGTDGVKIAATNALNVGTNDGFTFEAWFNIPNVARRNPVFEWEDGSTFAGPLLFLSADVPGSLHCEITEVGNISHGLITGGNLFGPNQWHHVGVTYNRLTGMGTLYLNGAIVRQLNLGSFTAKTMGNLFIGRRATPGTEESFQGLIDEPSLYTQELTESEMRSIFNAGSSGKCRNRSWLTVSPLTGTLAVGAQTNVTFTLNTNANRLSIGIHSESVLFTNATHRRGTTERAALLAVLNRAPTLGPLGPVQLAEDSGPRTVDLTGISAGGSEIQVLSITAASSNPSLIGNPLPIDYISPGTSGRLTFAPLTNAHGTSMVSVIVRDSGATANGAVDAVTNSFLVTVTAVNDAPTMPFVPEQTVAEGTLLMVTNIADDVDLPEDQLTFTLSGAPAGLSIDPVSRVLSWTPDETQGPGTYQVSVQVSDSGTPPLRATNRFAVNVLEVNEAPAMFAIADRTVHAGVVVRFNALATDPDLPANLFTYSLGPDAPIGASISPGGAFTWTPAALPIPSTNRISVIVTDNGLPPLIDTKSVNILVLSRPLIESITRSGDSVTLRWTAIPGARYRVQAKPKLGDAAVDWGDLPGDVTATADTASKSDSLGTDSQRFYRILVVP
jgi:uncharacterized repeat protein (TIGR01451 family)